MEDTKNPRSASVAHQVLVGAFAAAAALGATNAVAAVDVFLELDGVKGESADAKHPGAIDVLAWSWGLNGATAGDKKNPGTPACAEPLSVDKLVDIASPLLVNGTTLNKTYATGKLMVRKAGKSQFEFLVLDLTDVTVKGLVNGGPDAAGLVNERLTLAYTSVKFKYTPQKDDGSPGPSVTGTGPGSCP